MDAALPPGPPHAARTNLRWIRDPEGVLDDCARRYGEPFTLRLTRLPPFVVTWDPATVKAIFTGDHDVLRSGDANASLQAMLGPRSLMLLDGDEHLHERRLMLPPFHGERMRAYGETVTTVAERTVAGWPAGRPFEVAPHTRAMALEVIMRAVFGVGERDRLERLGRALRRVLDTVVRPYRVAALFLLRPGGATSRIWRSHSPTMRPVGRLVREEIRRRRAAPGDDILSMLIEARDEHGRALDDEHLLDELLTLLVAGHETTAIGLTWALAHLARDPELAERAAADGEVLDAVVKETLRLHPILPFCALREVAAPVELAGRAYPAGVRLAVSSYLMHRRADVYPDPLAFRPERFVEQPAGTYTWIPFGGGRRRCLGASFAMFELNAVLAAVLRAGMPHAVDPDLGPGVRRGLTVAPADGGRIVFEPRPPAATAPRPRSAAA
jgi:cytochrome P450